MALKYILAKFWTVNCTSWFNNIYHQFLVICNRTHQYTTASNSTRTVHVLDIFNTKDLEPYIESHVPKEDRDPRVKPKVKREVERVWSDKSGKFSIRATLTSVADGKVTLLKPDGTEKVVPLDVLSKKDLEWVEGRKEWISRRAFCLPIQKPSVFIGHRTKKDSLKESFSLYQ